MTREEFGKLLNLEVDLIPPGKRNRPGTAIKPTNITVHNTDNETLGADARAHAKLLKNTGHYVYKGKIIWVSWHFTVDDKRVIRHLPLGEMGYHAPNGNAKSLGVEICMNSGIDQDAAFLRAARLIATLLYDLKLDTEAIVPHHRWTRKNCPRLLLTNGKPGAKWEAFKALVKKELGKIE